MSRSAGANRLPRDVRTRERLLEAQRAEAAAVTAVCAAQEVLRKASEKRDSVVAAALVAVNDAQAAVQESQAALVSVSGVDRAALLMDVDPAEFHGFEARERNSGGATSRGGRQPRRAETQ